jgi:hypothetical protein
MHSKAKAAEGVEKAERAWQSIKAAKSRWKTDSSRRSKRKKRSSSSLSLPLSFSLSVCVYRVSSQRIEIQLSLDWNFKR